MGRAAWSRRPPLTRERKNLHLPPSRAGRVTFSRTLTRWSTAGRAGRQGFGGGAFPADGGTDGLGRSLSVDSSGRGIRHHPAEKTPLRAAQRVGFSPSTAKMGVSARSGQKPDIDLAAAALPSASTPSDLHPLHHLHQGRRARKLLTTRRVRFSIEDLVLPELRPRLEYRERGRQGVPRIVQLERDLLAVEDVSDRDGEA